MDRKLKKYLILAAASIVGFVICVFLHNVTYGLLIYLFGEDFWDKIGISDEPFFFLLAIVVCPVLCLIGVVGSIILIINKIINLSAAKKS